MKKNKNELTSEEIQLLLNFIDKKFDESNKKFNQSNNNKTFDKKFDESNNNKTFDKKLDELNKNKTFDKKLDKSNKKFNQLNNNKKFNLYDELKKADLISKQQEENCYKTSDSPFSCVSIPSYSSISYHLSNGVVFKEKQDSIPERKRW